MAILIRVDGVESGVDAEDAIEGFTSSELTRLLGGNPRVVLLDAQSAMIINPSASQMGASTNRRATEVLVLTRLKTLAELWDDDICGNALIARYDEIQLPEVLRESC